MFFHRINSRMSIFFDTHTITSVCKRTLKILKSAKSTNARMANGSTKKLFHILSRIRAFCVFFRHSEMYAGLFLRANFVVVFFIIIVVFLG